MKIFSLLIFCGLASKGICQNATSLLRLGNDYYRKGQYELAAARYSEVLRADASNEVAQYNLANALHQQKKFKEAIGILKKLTAASKNAGLKEAALYNQGVAHTRLKELDESIELYKAALRLDPNDQEARENLQKALLEKKKDQQRQNQEKQKQDPRMSQKEADQKLKLLQQKEKAIRQRQQDKGKQPGSSQAQDW